MSMHRFSRGQLVCDSIADKTVRLADPVGRLMEKVTDNWLLGIRESNPAILDMFRDSERTPLRDMLPWSGEFAGKYVTAAAQIYSVTHDRRLFAYVNQFVMELISGKCQKPGGYLGPWPEGHRLTGHSAPMCDPFNPEDKPHELPTWDAWGHYHIMYGLMRWFEITGQSAVLAAAMRIANLFLARFYNGTGKRLWDMDSQDMNLSPVHSFTLLYEMTGYKPYLHFAEEIAKDFEKPPAGDYIRCALAGQEFWQMPKPRWESLHSVEGVAELYLATGEEDYKTAFTRLWESTVRTDVHNTGAFSSREQAIGTPYRNWQIETCCVIAHMAMSVDMLRLTGSVAAADMLEWATYNAGMGAISPSGRWSTYNTPMEGYKRANFHEIGFQCRPGSPELNCCSVNAPRALGLISDWCVMQESGGAVLLNYYGEGTTDVGLADARRMTLTQKTAYPYGNTVRITVSGLAGIRQTLRLRIPGWSKQNSLTLNGAAQSSPVANTYYTLDRVWGENDEIVLTLDFALRATPGDEEYRGKTSLFCGPVLLCYDPYFDREGDFDHRPVIDVDTVRVLSQKPVPGAGMLFTLSTADGGRAVFTDLHTAGRSGSPYTTWFDAPGAEPVPFSFDNIRRNRR